MKARLAIPAVILLFSFSVLGRFHFDADSLRNATALIVSKGYPVERHTAVTKDGYILGMQRIPFGRNETPVRVPGQKKPVVLLVHGLAISSADFVLNFPEQSLGFILADAGYDVWLGNLRGNVYTSHVEYTKHDRAFWDFSSDEMIEFDAPAMIDMVLDMTNETKLHYVGFSQGTQILFGLLAEHPDYNDKISLFVAMGPAVYIGHMRATAVLLIPFSELIVGIVEVLSKGGVLQINWRQVLFAIFLCGDDLTIALCLETVEIANGIDWNQLNVTRLPVYLSHIPAGTSIYNLYHFAQMYRCGCFRKFSHGVLKNIRKYGSVKPPAYDVTRVRAPVGLYYSNGDVYVVPEDVAKLQNELPNVVRSYLVPDDDFTHFDFVLGMHTAEIVYRDMLQLMDQYRSQ